MHGCILRPELSHVYKYVHINTFQSNRIIYVKPFRPFHAISSSLPGGPSKLNFLNHT